MTIAVGPAKQLRFKKETTWGTAAGTSGGQLLRRVTSDIDLSKDTYESNEITSTYQLTDFRHGARKVGGTIKGELSPGSYSAFVQSALRRDFSTVTASTALSLTFAGTGPTYTVARSAGSFLTDGWKVGMVVRVTAGSVNANNTAKNLLITSLVAGTATVVPGGNGTLTAEGPIASCTMQPTGKITYVPASGHTNDSYSIEHWYSDISQSELFTGCKIASLDLSLPPTGMATIDIGVLGKDMTTGTAAYFSSPSAATTTGVLAAVNGTLQVNGSTVGIVTGLSIRVDGGHTTGAVVGSNYTPDVFPGRVKVSGQLSAYFENATMRDLFLNETTFGINAVFYTGSTAAADFIAVTLPACKAGGASKSDGEQGLQLTMPFQAVYNSSGGSGISSEATTIWMQDSQAA